MIADLVKVARIVEDLGRLKVDADRAAETRAALDELAGDLGLVDEVERGWQEILLECAQILRTGEPGNWRSARALGTQFARKGLSLEQLLECGMLIRRLAVDLYRSTARAEGLEAAEGIAALTHELAEAMLMMNRSHAETEARERSRTRASTERFVWAVLTGADIGPEGAELSTIDRSPSRRYRAFRAHPAGSDRAGLLRLLGIDEERQVDTGMVTTVRGDLCGFTSLLELEREPPVLVGMSDPVPFGQLPTAFREATRAFETARTARLGGIQTLETLGLLPAIVVDRPVAEHLTAKYLDPLRELGEYGDLLRETVVSYFENALQVDVVAAQLGTHVNTVRYRIAKFEDLFQVSLRDTSVLVEIWWALRLP